MGKKIVTLNQASLKISKHQRNHHQHQQQQQQQFNSLIKVLRPRVYITDNSCFKKLVQELTGNGTAASLHDDHLLLGHESSKKVATVPEIEDRHHHLHGGDDSSELYFSNQASSDQYFSNQTSSDQYLSNQTSSDQYLSNQTSSEPYLSNQASSSMSSDGVSNRRVFEETYSFEEELMTLEHSTSNGNLMVDSLSPGGASAYSKSSSFSCDDLKSWFLDMEMQPEQPASPFWNSLAQSEPEVSIYDYELSGLL